MSQIYLASNQHLVYIYPLVINANMHNAQYIYVLKKILCMNNITNVELHSPLIRICIKNLIM